MGSIFTTTIRVSRTVRYRGGLTIDRGAILPAQPVEGGYAVEHPTMGEGCFAHVPATNAVEVTA